jgi:hypothetical protein
LALLLDILSTPDVHITCQGLCSWLPLPALLLLLTLPLLPLKTLPLLPLINLPLLLLNTLPLLPLIPALLLVTLPLLLLLITLPLLPLNTLPLLLLTTLPLLLLHPLLLLLLLLLAALSFTLSTWLVPHKLGLPFTPDVHELTCGQLCWKEAALLLHPTLPWLLPTLPVPLLLNLLLPTPPLLLHPTLPLLLNSLVLLLPDVHRPAITSTTSTSTTTWCSLYHNRNLLLWYLIFLSAPDVEVARHGLVFSQLLLHLLYLLYLLLSMLICEWELLMHLPCLLSLQVQASLRQASQHTLLLLPLLLVHLLLLLLLLSLFWLCSPHTPMLELLLCRLLLCLLL